MIVGQYRGKRLFAGRLFAGRLFGPVQAPALGGAGPETSRAGDHEAALRRRLLDDDETLIFAIAAWAASRRIH